MTRKISKKDFFVNTLNNRETIPSVLFFYFPGKGGRTKLKLDLVENNRANFHDYHYHRFKFVSARRDASPREGNTPNFPPFLLFYSYFLAPFH